MSMSLLESIKEYGNTMAAAIQKMVEELFGNKMSEDDAIQLVRKLSLSDILAINKALEDDDIPTIQNIITDHLELREVSQVPNTVPGGNKVATGTPNRPQQPTTRDDSEEDEDQDENADDTRTALQRQQSDLNALKKKAGIR